MGSFVSPPPAYIPDENHDDGIVGYMICDETAGLIADTYQDTELNVHAIQVVEDQEQWDG
jgi:hypothetical protein